MRQRPPNRRSVITETIRVDNVRMHVSYGFAEDHKTCVEVFFRAGKPGSPLDIVMQDLGILLSVAMQSGVSPLSLLEGAQKLDNGSPAGPLGTVLLKIVQDFSPAASPLDSRLGSELVGQVKSAGSELTSTELSPHTPGTASETEGLSENLSFP